MTRGTNRRSTKDLKAILTEPVPDIQDKTTRTVQSEVDSEDDMDGINQQQHNAHSLSMDNSPRNNKFDSHNPYHPKPSYDQNMSHQVVPEKDFNL